ncbi:MAG: cell surface protein [Flavobacteriaceae bacterium CG17_big_fil_post_rev_8_21_14_2_50_33_15]|nr:MAG: cell surface protein [Flavobacteriaceae bacterium CG17_big_fil_post_rev_8_21_14_2_50_33_15]
MFTLFLILTGCNKQPEKITNKKDYNQFLEYTENEMLQLTKDDYMFWEKKLEKEPHQFPYLVKAAASQSLLFNETGTIDYLIEAERKLIEANKKTNYKNAGYLRALARNNISQHKFREALQNLKKAEMLGEKLNATQKMLFDVHMELGNYASSETYLKNIENYKDFDFLIRLSKWSDHKGDLDSAILYLRKATELAEASKNKQIIQWSYTNLADFYGHSSQIKEAYNYYIKSLSMNPNNAYAKKGIAWIVYAYENNPEEALRILNVISETHKAPDYYLLKSEIAEYMGNKTEKKSNLDTYLSIIENQKYGDMYNKHKAIIYAEEVNKKERALEIANKEIKNRPTPQSYDLLAWSYYLLGDEKEALNIMETYVDNKTFEPETLYHLALIYKANGKKNKALYLKNQLSNCTFELGPIMSNNVNKI